MLHIQEDVIWPTALAQPSLAVEHDIYVTSADKLAADASPTAVHIITDGWRDGRLAAVLRGGNNAVAVLDVLAAFGIQDIEIYHIEEKVPDLEKFFLDTVVDTAHELFRSVNIYWRRSPSITALLAELTPKYDMLFLGAPLAVSELPPFFTRLKQHFPGHLAIVRSPLSDYIAETPEKSTTDEVVRWVYKRTFEGGDFSVPSLLLRHKKRLNKKIAVILPSLNEEKTVGQVIETALEVKQTGIIDEVILIDSSSTDNTVAVARDYGIPVYIHQEIRPDLGIASGKGEAMFKSAFVTDADIIAWVDTDIENITPRFFYGLLGPLLVNEEIKFVKGYFARPVRVTGEGVELGGGRVTEIFARPWINANYPSLAGYIQPLAGTVAIYRDLFRQMHIPTNYGVEMAMLIQAVEKAGLWATSQVNLGEVIHKSKAVQDLSEMAYQILQVLNTLRTPPTQLQSKFRRVHTHQGQIELGIKNLTVIWRQFPPLNS